MKDEGPNWYQSKDMVNVKVFAHKQTIYQCGDIKILSKKRGIIW